MAEHLKTIRSFVKRQGRMSKRQQHALEQYWGQYGIDYQADGFDLDKAFARHGKTVVEIGFGMGKSLVEQAKANPDCNYLGIEVHTPGVGTLLADCAELNLSNVRIIQHDAVEVLKFMLDDKSIDLFQIFFPDPWHKKRHHKRRLIQAPFVELLISKLKAGGIIHCATDWQGYAEQMMQVLTENQHLTNCVGPEQYSERPESRPLTKFEQRGHRLGHGVWDLLFQLKE